jgi:hypothetical protein
VRRVAIILQRGMRNFDRDIDSCERNWDSIASSPEPSPLLCSPYTITLTSGLSLDIRTVFADFFIRDRISVHDSLFLRKEEYRIVRAFVFMCVHRLNCTWQDLRRFCALYLFSLEEKKMMVVPMPQRTIQSICGTGTSSLNSAAPALVRVELRLSCGKKKCQRGGGRIKVCEMPD